MPQTRIPVHGTIVTDDDGYFYDFLAGWGLNFDYTAPGKFRAALEAVPAGDSVLVDINSPGGYVSSAAEIYDMISSYPGEIRCHVTGMAGSAASLIAVAGKNSIDRLGTLYVHNSQLGGGVRGNHNEFESAAQGLRATDENIVAAYEHKTGLPREEILNLMEHSTTLSAAQAVELGFIDEISDSAPSPTAFVGSHGITDIAPGMAGLVDTGNMTPERIEALAKALSELQLTDNGIAEGRNNMEENLIETSEPVDIEPTEPEAAAEVTEAAEAPAQEPQDGEPAAEPVDVAAIQAEAVEAERNRIRDILDIADGLPRELVTDALFDHPTDAAALALNVLRSRREGDAQAAATWIANSRSDAQESGASKVAAPVTDQATDEKAEAQAGLSAAMSKKINR